MNRQTRSSTLTPLPGVIDTLTAGLFLMARHAWLLVLPIVLDIFLWLAPPLVIGARLREAVLPPLNMGALLVGAPDPEMVTEMQALYDGLAVQISQTNFWGWVIPGGLFFPSVMAGAHPAATDLFWTLDSPFTFFATFVGLTLLGLLINISWLHTVAFAITRNPALIRATAIVKSYLRVIGLGLLLILIFIGTLFAAFLLLAVLTLLLPGVGTAIFTLAFLIGLWWAIWVGVQFYFTVASIVIGREGILGAPNSSAFLLRREPGNPHWRSGYGFIFISVILSWGFLFIWQSLMANPTGILVSIIGNAALGTGITAAMMLFYHQRTNSKHEEQKQSVTA